MASPTVDVVVQAQDRARAVLRSVDKQLQKTRGTLASMEEPQNRVTGAITAGHAALGALAGGVLVSIAHQFAEMAVEGAKIADQYDAVAARVENLDAVIARTQSSTTGLFSQADIVDFAAQFDAFGLGVDRVDVAMEQVAKTAIRLGRPVEKLAEQLATGVSKLSDPRLDDLGIVGAVKAARAALERTGEAFDDAALRAEVLRRALNQLGEQNKDISLNDTRSASLQRLAAAWTDAKNEAAEYLADAADLYLPAAQASDAATKKSIQHVHDLALHAHVLKDSFGGVESASADARLELGAAQRQLEALPAAMRLKAWDDLNERVRNVEPGVRAAALEVIGFREELEALVQADIDTEVAAIADGFDAVSDSAWRAAQNAAAAAAAVAGFFGDAAKDRSARLHREQAKADEAARRRRRGGARDRREEAAREAEALAERVRGLQQEVALAQTKDERQRAVLELTFEEARIDREITDSLEHQLSMQAALLDFKEKIAKIEAPADLLAGFGKLASPEELERLLAVARSDDALQLSQTFDAASASLAQFAALAGDNSTLANFAGLGSALQGVGSIWSNFVATGNDSAEAIAGASAATLAALAPSVAAFGSSVEEKAGIMAGFEAAMAIATAFTNPAESVGHGIAAAMFAAQAGGAFGGAPSAPATAGGGSAAFGGGGFGSAGGSGGAPTYIVNVGSTHGGMVIGTEQTIARAVKEQMHAARGTGHRAGA